MSATRPVRARKPARGPAFEQEDLPVRKKQKQERKAVVPEAEAAALTVEDVVKTIAVPVCGFRGESVIGQWTPEQDAMLHKGVWKYGQKKWALIAQEYVAGRSGKQCRERWCNYLNPNIEKGPWTVAEDLIVHAGVFELGHRWSVIAQRLPGRTDNQIKNRYNCFLQSKTASCMDDEAQMQTAIKLASDSARSCDLPATELDDALAPEVAAPKKPKGSALDDAELLLELKRRNAVTDGRRKSTLFKEAEEERRVPKREEQPGLPWSFEEELRLATGFQIELKRKSPKDKGWHGLHSNAWRRIAQFVRTRSASACKRHWGLYANSCKLAQDLLPAASQLPDLPELPELPEPPKLTEARKQRAVPELHSMEPFALEDVLDGCAENMDEVGMLCFETVDEITDANAPSSVSTLYHAKTRPRVWGAVNTAGISFCFPPPPARLRRKSGTKGTRKTPGETAAKETSTTTDCAGTATHSLKDYYSEEKRRAAEELLVKNMFV